MPLWWRAAIKVFAECAELSALMYRRFDEALALYAAMAAPDDAGAVGGVQFTAQRARRMSAAADCAHGLFRRRGLVCDAATFVTTLRACRGRAATRSSILHKRVSRRLLEDVTGRRVH